MKQVITAFVLSMVLSPLAMAKEVAGVNIDDTMSAAGKTLNLQGAGIRTKWFMDIYVGGLYTASGSRDAMAVINADEPQAIKLHMVSGLVTSEKMQSATNEGFVNATGGNVAPIKADIDAFMGVFQEEIKENDVFDLVYVPSKGVEVYKNAKLKDTIGDMTFKKALFGIWLSDNPAQDDLKKAMLGK
ncbi:chalcone-flavanone isomerase [Oleiphilus messinensis]|uniref:Chalcone-flavanone isomerase n=1 Tax=Oleiphilus messinensis TaxID=141451 RepID=A0A1Y0IAV2_9GAMM|nr:chalcone isomerase family protein [Oleiphilus messinensis]ARU57662.1 chalcone-flavanone isomerase [Oleiphilus messinensis]